MKNVLIFLLILFVTACTVSKDNKALTRVITNPALSSRAYAELVKMHPIRIDSVVTYLEGKPVITYDTIFQPVNIIDTLLGDTVRIIRYVDRYLTKLVRTTDTIKIRVPDSRALDAANTQITVLQTQLRASQENDSKHLKGKKNWILAFSGSLLFLLLGIILVLKKKV